MKKLGSLFVVLFITLFSYTQTLSIKPGITISDIDWSLGNFSDDLYDQVLIGHSVFLGINYLDNMYYNLSSNIGILNKGGSTKVVFTDKDNNPIEEKIVKAKLEYLSFNTLLELTYPIKENYIPYIGFGPRLDYLINHNSEFDVLEEGDNLKKLSAGMLLEGGFKYSISKMEVGFGVDYYLN